VITYKNYRDFLIDKIGQPSFSNFEEFKKKLDNLNNIKKIAIVDQALTHLILSKEDKNIVPLFGNKSDEIKLHDYLLLFLPISYNRIRTLREEFEFTYSGYNDANSDLLFLQEVVANVKQDINQIIDQIVAIFEEMNFNPIDIVSKIYLQKLVKLAGGSHYIMDKNTKYYTFGSYLFYISLFESLLYENAHKSFMDVLREHSGKDPKWIKEQIIEKPMVLPQLWPHQKEALNHWRKNKRYGIIEMATATGKTLVGLAAIEDIARYFRDPNGPITVLIVSHSTNILNQWRKESIEKLGLLGNPCLDYKTPLSTSKIQLKFDTAQKILRKPSDYDNPGQFLIIDEVHHFAANEFNKILNIQHKWFMGLSASIEDEREKIFKMRNKIPILYRFKLRDAIDRKIIPDFCWKIHPVRLDDNEQRIFESLTKSINKTINEIQRNTKAISFARTLYESNNFRFKTIQDFIQCIEIARLKGKIDELPECLKVLQNLLIKRRFILNTSIPKIKLAINLAKRYADSRKCLIFTMDIKSCDNIANELKNEIGYVDSIHSNLKQEEVKKRLEKFRRGENGVLVAAKMLDEGVDIPDAEIGINAAASRTRLQLIQRMGRILRKDPKNPYKRPVFHHLVAIPRFNDRIEYEDDLMLLDNDSWVKDTAFKLGIVPIIEPIDQEIEFDKQWEKAAKLQKDLIKGGSAYSANIGTIKIENIISSMPKKLRTELVKAIKEKFMDMTSYNDENWIIFLRDFCIEKRVSTSYFNGPFWWVLELAERNPRKLIMMLQKGGS